ncbi:MAG: type II secretion system F family protein [Demequina sp.]|uniref:type II secretion system F family protein n=1 Tax=Demequina sp. TaxID=2050685 RepID=UPI003A8575F4
MPELFAVILGALVAGGAVAVWAGLRGARLPRGTIRRPVPAPSALVQHATPSRVAWGAGAAALGVAAFVATGWPVAAVVVPLLAIGLPRLLAAPANRDLILLETLDRWVRLLTATISTGVSIPDAVRATRQQVPPALHAAVTALIARLDNQWSVRSALRAAADDMNSPDADAVIAALILAAERGGTGTVATLDALATSIAERLKAGREIEAERAKPRIVVRQVTVLTLAILGGAVLVGRDFFAPYGTWYGQIILACLLATYLGSLVWLRRMTLPRARERILQ